MEVSGQLHPPAALPPGKEPLVTMDRRVGGPQRAMTPTFVNARRCFILFTF